MSRKLRNLIVQQDVVAAGELKDRLVSLGHEVAALSLSGIDAIDVAARLTPDLVFMDVGLPGVPDGVAAAQTMGRAIPIIFIGTEAGEARLRGALGINTPPNYLVPPFSDRELRVTIEVALCKHDEEQAIHELEGFFAVSIDMFCFLDFSGYFKRLNPAWERTLGFTVKELMSKPFIEFVHPDDRERTLNQNAQVRGGGQATGFQNRYRCKDGSYRWLQWNASARTAEGVIYSVAHDITDRKRTEEERTQLVSRLEASLAEVRTLKKILPICMYCSKIRDDENYWDTVQSYIARHTTTQFSHGICPSCMTNVVAPQLDKLRDGS